MDIMAKVNELVEMITKNEALMKQFKADPMKAVQSLLGDLKLDDDVLKQLVKGVQGKISVDKAADLLGGLKKLF